MLFNFLNLWKATKKNRAVALKIVAGIRTCKSTPNSIIEKLYRPCKRTAIINPAKTSLLLFSVS